MLDLSRLQRLLQLDLQVGSLVIYALVGNLVACSCLLPCLCRSFYLCLLLRTEFSQTAAPRPTDLYRPDSKAYSNKTLHLFAAQELRLQ